MKLHLHITKICMLCFKVVWLGKWGCLSLQNLICYLFCLFLLSIDCIDPLILPNEQSFTRDVDEKANAYFQAIYNKSMSVDKLLELLKQFKDSSVKKDRVCSVQVIITPSVDDMYFFSGFVCLYAEKHV